MDFSRIAPVGGDPRKIGLFRGSTAVSAFTLVVWEYLITWKYEQALIWRRPFNLIKVLYVFARYTGLAVQSVNLYLFTVGPLSTIPIPEDVCRWWFVFMLTSATCLLAALDVFLTVQVYALYMKNVKITVFLATLIALELSLGFGGGLRAARSSHFAPNCNLNKTPREAYYFTVTAVLTQCTLAALTLAKRNITRLQSALAGVVVRDATWIFVLMCATFIAPVPASIMGGTVKPHVAFNWTISFLSIASCRLVLNVRRLGRHTPDQPQQTNNDNILLTAITDFSAELDIHDELDCGWDKGEHHLPPPLTTIATDNSSSIQELER